MFGWFGGIVSLITGLLIAFAWPGIALANWFGFRVDLLFQVEYVVARFSLETYTKFGLGRSNQ